MEQVTPLLWTKMKLQQKINIRYSAFSVMVFLVAGVLLYLIIKITVHENIDKVLRSREDGLKYYLNHNALPDSNYQSIDYTISIQSYSGRPFSTFSDTLAYDFETRKLRPFRKFSFSTTINSKSFQVKILQSKLESEDLIEIIFYFMLGLLVLLVLVLFLLSHRIYASIWTPFFQTLDKLKMFKIGEKQQVICLPQTGTDEFDILNQTLNEMTAKLQSDFITLKEFTENASHEIQTPLAIIKSKLEKTLHNSSLPKIHRGSIYVAYEATIRLSKLNSALLLLSKIENRQFVKEQDVDLMLIINSWLNEVDELIQLKNIQIILLNPSPCIVKMNPHLATILINNLAGNALKHCSSKGEITIKYSDDTIEFSNPGQPLSIPPDKLFKRFSKQSTGNESTGLGLAIAKEICNMYHLELNYRFENGNHSFTLPIKQ